MSDHEDEARVTIELARRPYAFDSRGLVCRHCGLKMPLSSIHTLFHESANGCAKCFCGGIEWDGPL